MMYASGNSALDRIAARLVTRFHGLVSLETARRLVADSYDGLRASSRVDRYLLVITERFAAQRLSALAQAEGLIDKPVPELLFVCDANAGRSQMAAALALARGRGRVHARSAGVSPAAELELAIVEVLGEIDVDVSAEFPKPLTDELVQAADVVITLGCGGACPIALDTRYLDWPVPDPAGQSAIEVRRIRDELDLLVTGLLSTLDRWEAGGHQKTPEVLG